MAKSCGEVQGKGYELLERFDEKQGRKNEKALGGLLKRANNFLKENEKERSALFNQEELSLDALRKVRNLEHKSQDRIDYFDTLPDAGGYNNHSLVVVGSVNPSLFMKINNNWVELGAGGSTGTSQQTSRGRGRRSNGSRSSFAPPQRPSHESVDNPLYNSGWFAVANNTTYTAGTTSGFGSFSKNPSSLISLHVRFSTAANDETMYNVRNDGTTSGVSLKVSSGALIARTGSSYITQYYDGSSWQNATSGYLKIYSI